MDNSQLQFFDSIKYKKIKILTWTETTRNKKFLNEYFVIDL